VELNPSIVARLKYLQQARMHRRILGFNVGDCVSLNAPGHDPKTSVIIEYNRQTVTVVTDDHHQRKVAPVFLSRVVEAAADHAARPAQVVHLPIEP